MTKRRGNPAMVKGGPSLNPRGRPPTREPIEDYGDGFSLALELRDDAKLRDAVMSLRGPTWSAAYLRGFLEACELMVRLRTCTCLRCPIHTDGSPTAIASSAS
jgi:hypothetical protein